MKKEYICPNITSITFVKCPPIAASNIKNDSTESLVPSEKKKEFLRSFFGINLLEGRGGNWSYLESSKDNKGKLFYNFNVTDLNMPIFNDVTVSVSKESLIYHFIAQDPDHNDIFHVIHALEKNLIYGETCDWETSRKRNFNRVSKQESIEITLSDLTIQIHWPDSVKSDSFELIVRMNNSIFDNVKELVPDEEHK